MGFKSVVNPGLLLLLLVVSVYFNGLFLCFCVLSPSLSFFLLYSSRCRIPSVFPSRADCAVDPRKEARRDETPCFSFFDIYSCLFFFKAIS